MRDVQDYVVPIQLVSMRSTLDNTSDQRALIDDEIDTILCGIHRGRFMDRQRACCAVLHEKNE